MTQEFEKRLQAICPSLYKRDEPMSKHSTFKTGGMADFFITPSSRDMVIQLLLLCDSCQMPYTIVGRGSNILVSDQGIRGAVIQMCEQFSHIECKDNNRIFAQAGARNASIAHFALKHNLGGFEGLAGVPGTIGGACMMNAGAYGYEIKDVVEEVICINRDREIITMRAQDAQWDYRSSLFMIEGYIITDVHIILKENDAETIKNKMRDFACRRRDKQPLEYASAGSTFKRPPGHFAGKLIQDANLQGFHVGDAEVSTKHAGFIINKGNASSSQILEVIYEVQGRVYEQFGVRLELEVRLLGFDN